MTNQPHLSLTLHNTLSTLHNGLSKYDPHDQSAGAKLVAQFGELRGCLEREGLPELSPLCDLCLRLLHHLSRSGVVGPRETADVLRDTVESITAVAGGTSANLPDRSLEPKEEASGDQAPSQLKLIDEKRLGEILITMSMLTQDEVENALKRQRVTGRRLGETLVELEILTEEAVQAALKVQRFSTREDDDHDPETWIRRRA